MKISFLSLIGFLIVACCREKDSNSGDILSEIDVSYTAYFYSDSCYQVPEKCYIISDSIYQKTFSKLSSNSNCETLTLPAIDFSQYSLLIYKTYDNENIYYHRNVVRDAANKKVTYSITTSKCACPDKCVRIELNGVLIPKIDSAYTVTFQ